MSIPLPQPTSPFTSFMQGMGSVQQYRQNQENIKTSELSNQLAQLKNKYAPETIEADLKRQELENQYNVVKNQFAVPGFQSELASAASTRALQGTEAAKNRFMVNNPLFMTSGIGNQLGAIAYVKSHPELANMLFPQAAQQQPMAQQSPQFQQRAPQLLPNNLLSPQFQNQGIGGLPSGASQGLQRIPQPEAPVNALAPQAPSDIPNLSNDPLVNSLLTAPFVKAKLDQQRGDYYEKMTKAANWTKLPMSFRGSQLAQAGGMGVSPQEAEQFFMDGGTIDQLAVQKGFGKNPSEWPQAIWPTTTASLNLIQRRAMYNSELNSITGDVARDAAPYSQRFMGYSPKQIVESLTNTNPDAVGKYLGVMFITPELASLRVKNLQGEAGVQFVKEVMDRSMLNMKALNITVTPEEWKIANDYVTNTVNKAVSAAQKQGLTSFTTTEQAKRNIKAEQDNTNEDDSQKTSAENLYSDENLEYTAKRKGISVTEVKKRLGI